MYATYLSEKIGYWRYISIYRHLQRSPDDQIYPLFEYFENWCQDENRHGDFLGAVLKARPELLNDWVAKLWSRFFCLSVYITMYLNDNQRSEFYESIGLNTKQVGGRGPWGLARAARPVLQHTSMRAQQDHPPHTQT